MIIKFPSGHEVDVIFDEQAHTYVVAQKLADGKFTDYKPTHGITAPLSTVAKPFLTAWAAKECAEALLEELIKNPMSPEDIEQFFIDKKAMDDNERYIDEKGKDKPVMSSYRFKKTYPWFGRAKVAYKRKAEVSKEIGHWLHSSIENYYKSGRTAKPILTPETEPMWDSFLMFDNFYKPRFEPEGLEFLVYSLMFGYSGQGDCQGYMSGKTCIGDWKTTNRNFANEDGITSEYFFQLGGLAQAEFERTGKWVEDLFIANFDKKGGEPRVVWASEFGMSPQDCARAYISCFNNYHMIAFWDYKFKQR